LIQTASHANTVDICSCRDGRVSLFGDGSACETKRHYRTKVIS